MANAALNFKDALEANAKPKDTKTKKKDTKEIIIDAPENVKKSVSAVIKAKAAKKKAESDIKVNEAPVIEFGKNLKDDRAFNGDYNKSYKIQGENEDDVVNFVTANKFSFKSEDEEEIAEILGDDVDELMPKYYEIKVKAEVFEDEDMQKELMDLVGDKFAKFFDVDSGRKVTSNFDEEIYKRYDKDTVEDLKVYVKQSKPSLR